MFIFPLSTSSSPEAGRQGYGRRDEKGRSSSSGKSYKLTSRRKSSSTALSSYSACETENEKKAEMMPQLISSTSSWDRSSRLRLSCRETEHFDSEEKIRKCESYSCEKQSSQGGGENTICVESEWRTKSGHCRGHCGSDGRRGGESRESNKWRERWGYFEYVLAVLLLVVSCGPAVVSGKLVVASNDTVSGVGAIGVGTGGGVHFIGPVQSENFISCHFNPLCFCKYDQKTEIYDTVRRLWQMVGFNQSNFFSAVQSLVHHMKHETTTTYFISEGELYNFASLLVNASMSPVPQSPAFLVEPGPVFDIECSDVPIALIPTEYNSHGVISHVSVSGSKLGMLDGSAFAGLQIQGIRLSRDELYFINEYAFSSVSNSLSMLDLSGNYLDEVPYAAFKSLKLLEWLNLSNNLLNSIAGDWFLVPTSMRKLLLSGNSIDSLPNKLLTAFPRLHWLDLSSNFIRNLTQDNLPPNLQTLNVMKNRLSRFPLSIFHLNSLSWIFLGGCSIEEVPQEWPYPAPPRQVNQIDLSDNFIHVWPSKAFGSQLSVLDMSVSKNQLTTLPDAAFYGMNIFRLSLGYNRIQMIDPGAFASLESTLKYLNLENNRLRTIPWMPLSNLTSLMHLYIGSNGIQDEGIGTPQEGMECKLTYLGLNGNQLTRIPRNLLMLCPHLYHLNLGYNQISHLDDFLHLGTASPGGATSKIRKLRYLSTLILRNNPIRTLSYTYSAYNSVPLVNSPNMHGGKRNVGGVSNVLGHSSGTSSAIPSLLDPNTSDQSREEEKVTGNFIQKTPEVKKHSTASADSHPTDSYHKSNAKSKDASITPHHLASTSWMTVGPTHGILGPGPTHSHGKHGRESYGGSGGNFMNSHEAPLIGRGKKNSGRNVSGKSEVTQGFHHPGILASPLKSNGVSEEGGPSGVRKNSGGSGGYFGTSIFRSEIFTNLHELSLSFCSLNGELEAFPSLPLTTLEISMGLKSATTLHPGLFNSLRNLEWLALDHNSLSIVRGNTFYSNRKLSYVNLEWNRLGELPPLMFHPDIHQGMTQLRLSHNRIQTIPTEAFLSFPAINLDLSYNQISTIEKHAFLSQSEGGNRKTGTTATTTFAHSKNPRTGHAVTDGDGGASNSQNTRMKMSNQEEDGVTNPASSYSGNVIKTTSSSTGSTASGRTGSGSNGAGGHGNSGIPMVAAVAAAAVIGNGDDHPGLNVYLNHNRLSSLRTGAFSQEKFNVIDLSYNAMNSFNFDVFGRRTIIEGLNLSHNSLERLNLKQRWAGNHIIKFLDLSHNRIPYRGIDFTSLCITSLLDLSYNKIDKTDAKIFPHNCSLKELRLAKNSIATVDPGSFANLHDLTVLDLSSNQISLLSPVVFIRNTQLRHLDLSNNRLRSLPRDCLIGSSIEVVNLGSNQFVNLPVGALSQISRRLRRLDMSENSLEHLDSTMFESIPGLVHLNLSRNRLSILPDNAFENLASLRELDLSYNFLRATFKEVFHHLPKLKLLRLKGCGIKTLPFLPLPHLISLDLASNGLEEISMANLGSLTRLRHLDLSHNALSSGDIPTWTPLYNLVTLKLSNNPLKSFTKDTFYGLGKLENLEIVDISRPERFDSDVFSHMTNLRSLAVETHPNIERFRFRLGAILSSIPHLEELRVIIKESTLSDQLNGIQPKLRKLTINGEKLRRIENNALEGLENCLHIDLAITHTSVDDIPPRIFEKLQSSVWARLDLSHNKLTSVDPFAFFPVQNRSLWYSRGTKTLEGGLVLNGNEWICDCNLVSLGEWLRRWLRESFQSHSTDNIPLVHAMYESLRAPVCTDGKGKTIPIIELYTDTMCHASALGSGSSSVLFKFPESTNHRFIRNLALLLPTLAKLLVSNILLVLSCSSHLLLRAT